MRRKIRNWRRYIRGISFHPDRLSGAKLPRKRARYLEAVSSRALAAVQENLH